MEYLAVGIILKPQGIRGELKVKPLTDHIERFHKLDWIYIKSGEQYIKTIINGKRIQKDFVYLSLEGVFSREEAEKYRGQYLWIDRENAVKLPKDSYFICDILDCAVWDLTGKEIGRVIDIIQTGSNDVYVVKTEKQELLIPAIKSVIKEVLIEKKRIAIDTSLLEEVTLDED